MLLCCLETTKTLMQHQASFPSYFLFILLLAIAWSRIRNICNHLCVQRDFILNFFLGSQCLCRRLTSLANSIASLRRNMVRNLITHWSIFLDLFRIIGNSNILSSTSITSKTRFFYASDIAVLDQNHSYPFYSIFTQQH